jgi:exodeoxyribonuclease VII large subunit
MTALNQSLAHAGQMLNSLSYKSVLARGYAIVRGADNAIISSVDGGTPQTIEFADGVIKL